MEVTLLGISIETGVSVKQFLNAEAPIDVTVVGISMRSRDKHFKRTFSLITTVIRLFDLSSISNFAEGYLLRR